MAEGKKSFIVYADLIHVVRKLIEQDRINKTNHGGELFLHLLSYVNDENPVPVNFIVDMAFEPVKQQLKRDLKQWEGTRGVRVESGHKGGIKSGEIRKEKAQTKQKEANEANASNAKQTEANEAVNVTVTDNVTANVNVNEEKKEGAFLPPSSLKNINQLSKELMANAEWVSLTCKSLSIELVDLTAKMISFLTHLQLSNDTAKTEKDFAKHFINFTRLKQTSKANGSTKKHIGSSHQFEPVTDPNQWKLPPS